MRLAFFIISHKRPECETWDVLRQYGYAGDMYVVIDDMDDTEEEYKQKFGDNLLIFHKDELAQDLGDNFGGPLGVATFARNACFNFARKLGYDVFVIVDDDLQTLSFRYESDGMLKGKKIKELQKITDAIGEYIITTGIDCMGIGVNMDYIGGLGAFNVEYWKKRRTVMNMYFFNAQTEVIFLGRFSEDTITPILWGCRGKVFLNLFEIDSKYDIWMPTKGNKENKAGGCVDTYKQSNSYVTRFYMVMFCPSCIKERIIDGDQFDTTIYKRSAWPLIMSGRWKK